MASTPETFADLKAFYRSGEPVTVAIPAGANRVIAYRATGESVEVGAEATATFDNLPAGTWAIEAVDAAGDVLAEELTTVGAHQGERPVHGFATSFRDEDVEPVLEWHRALRSTVVQIYDWMASYTEPLGPRSGWEDPSHRPVSFDALQKLAAGLREVGAVAHAYAPIYAVGNAFADEHPDMLMYQGDGQAIRFLDQIVLANPANTEWQQHFATCYGAAADTIGFDGFHIDTYGYPRIAQDADGKPIDLRDAYQNFLAAFRAARPADLVSFNQVNGVPSATALPAGPGFRYCEVWPPNAEWRHLEGLLDRSSGHAGMLAPGESRDAVVRGSIACYPPVWGIDQPGGPIAEADRPAALRTVVATDAIATMLGSVALIYGDRAAALCDPYYPKHATLSSEEVDTVLAWHRFALRCRDLFFEGEDTSWYEIDDENGSVAVTAEVPVRPEPVAGSLFARVIHAPGRITVGILDLTASPHGKWSERTDQGSVQTITVRILLDNPDRWTASAAVLGASNDRFTETPGTNVKHRQGHALEVHVPLVAGWTVLRISSN